MAYEISVEDPRGGSTSVSDIQVSDVNELRRKLKGMVAASVVLVDEYLDYRAGFKACNVDELSDVDLKWLTEEGTTRFIKLR